MLIFGTFLFELTVLSDLIKLSVTFIAYDWDINNKCQILIYMDLKIKLLYYKADKAI